MTREHKFRNGYYGRILKDRYSSDLKKRVEEYIWRFEAFDELGGPAIPYMAAWRRRGKKVWYEFVSKRLLGLLDCNYENAAEAFRNSIIERHRFIRRQNRKKLQEEILINRQVRGRKDKLRADVVTSGTVEAVYKMLAKNKTTLWVKDQAVLETFVSDAVYLSLGNLTVVTRELELEEQIKKAQIALTVSKRKYREQAIHDNLTGLYNTRHLYKALSALIKKSKKKNESFSLIFMDIDNFKTVVDKHGHLNASKALQQIGRTIKKNIKDPAFGVAYGGDEFVIVLPEYGHEQAIKKAESIREIINSTVYLPKTGLNISVSASLGISTFPEDATTLQDILALADQAMFHVKNKGKNSVYSLKKR